MKCNVLFLCSGNSVRSQMAEAFLRKYAGDEYNVYSAGLAPHEINPLTIEVMEEVGIDMTSHRAKDVSEYLGKVPMHFVIFVCADAERNCPRIWPGTSERLYWRLPNTSLDVDPNEGPLQRFRYVRDQVERAVLEWLQGVEHPCCGAESQTAGI